MLDQRESLREELEETRVDMFHYLTEHFEEHAADIRQSIAGSLGDGHSTG